MLPSETITMRIDSAHRGAFEELWKEFVSLEVAGPEADLGSASETRGADGAWLYQWTVQMAPEVVPIVTAILGFLIAKRGEIEITSKGQKLKFKNMKPRQIAEVLELIRMHMQKMSPPKS